MRKQRKPESVDAYIESHPEPIHHILAQVRSAIRQAAPQAEESISYNMPSYKLNGEPLLFFAAWKRHYSIYPANDRLLAAFNKELSPYKVQKGTIQFPLSEPVPTALIASIAKFRAEEVRPKLARSELPK